MELPANHMMNRTLFVGSLLALLLFSSFVSAERGLGIIWNSAAEIIGEGEHRCITYGAFNPGNEDYTSAIVVSDGLKPAFAEDSTHDLFLKAGTTKDTATSFDVCFAPQKVYAENCILGTLCEQQCAEEQVSYTGTVSITSQGEQGSGSGSVASFSASAPLTIRVRCDSHARNYTPVIVVGALVVVIAGFVAYQRKKRAA